MTDKEQTQDLPALLDYLKRNRGFDFTGYKLPSLTRRMHRRMNMVGIQKYTDYIDYLEVHPEEFIQLFNSILINVTGFFRDPIAWEYLRDEIVPKLIQTKTESDTIRVWSTGCASGEEAYSIAMLLSEVMGPEAYRDRVKIYATDVDDDALNRARQAVYTEKEVEDVPNDLLKKYFTHTNGSYIFEKEIRRNLIFGRNDLIQDAPISRVDLLICRNTLMYFNAEAQTRILARLHFSLRDTGFLFLGKAEMLLTHTNIFTPINLKLRVFRKVPKLDMRDRLLMIANTDGDDGMNGLVNTVRMRDSAFDASPEAQLVVDVNNALTLANDHARRLFGLNARDLGRPFQDLDISFRPVELRSSIQSAFKERNNVIIRDVNWSSPSGERHFYDVHVLPLFDNSNGSGASVIGMSIHFIDVTQHKQMQTQLEQVNHSLETAFEELQSTNEEMETTNEELQSTNEELETTNEELQSTNEELETMNEELQSSNEELGTINDELRQRTGELNQVNSFIESILTSMHASVIVNDRDLRVLVWNKKSEDLWGLRADEVVGMNFLNLDIGLPVEMLKKTLRTCLQGESDRQEVSMNARNRRGKEITCRVIVTPLIDSIKEIQGVIVMVDGNGGNG